VSAANKSGSGTDATLGAPTHLRSLQGWTPALRGLALVAVTTFADLLLLV